jgi:hypothetical protein
MFAGYARTKWLKSSIFGNSPETGLDVRGPPRNRCSPVIAREAQSHSLAAWRSGQRADRYASHAVHHRRLTTGLTRNGLEPSWSTQRAGRAQQVEVSGSVTIVAVMARFRCAYCARWEDDSRRELEHIIPRAIGGSVTTDRVCAQCNRRVGREVDAPLRWSVPPGGLNERAR